jgi:hypothetical protein
MKRPRQRSATRRLLCLLWAVAIIAGLHELTVYSNTSSEVRPQPAEWPQDTTVPRAGDRPTMVLALHPRCVCSRATLEELAVLLARVSTPPDVEILLYQPDTAADSWAQTHLAIRARSLPFVTVRADRKGRESERFGTPLPGIPLYMLRTDGSFSAEASHALAAI